MKLRRGTSRTVLLAGPWAFKIAYGQMRNPVRGWLANRSEWRQRSRPVVCRPICTLGHVVLVMPRAEFRGIERPFADAFTPCPPMVPGLKDSDDRDEMKLDSWGWFGDRWLLIDYDRCWGPDDRGLVGRIYWWNQERLGRKWAKLPRSS